MWAVCVCVCACVHVYCAWIINPLMGYPQEEASTLSLASAMLMSYPPTLSAQTTILWPWFAGAALMVGEDLLVVYQVPNLRLVSERMLNTPTRTHVLA